MFFLPLTRQRLKMAEQRSVAVVVTQQRLVFSYLLVVW